MGREIGSEVVALNHFGCTAVSEDAIESLLAEARHGNRNRSQIIASYDFMEVWIPRGGFNFKSFKDKP